MVCSIHCLKSRLKTILKEHRFQHVIGVCETAKELAQRYGADPEKAEIAALFHDYAKDFSPEEQHRLLQYYNIVPDEYQRRMPYLLHGILARCIAQKEFQLQDEDILNAIEFHTCGRKSMSLLEKIICLADYIEPNRDFSGVKKIRKLASKDLDASLYIAMNGTISYLIRKHVLIHPRTLEARNDLLQNLIQEKKEGLLQ